MVWEVLPSHFSKDETLQQQGCHGSLEITTNLSSSNGANATNKSDIPYANEKTSIFV
jgi:hypothetical protein